MIERQEMPWVRRLVVAAAVFGLVGGAAAPAFAQDEAASTGEEAAAQEPATLEDIVLADVAAEDVAPVEAPVEEASAQEAAAEQTVTEAPAGDAASADAAAVQEIVPVEGVPAEAIVPVPDPVQPTYMTPDALIQGEFPGAAADESAPVEQAAAPDASAESAPAAEDANARGGHRGGQDSTESLIGGVIDGITGGTGDAGDLPEDAVVVDGGSIDNSTNVDANTAGGTGAADGSGGDGNTGVAIAGDNDNVGNDGNNRGGRQGRPDLGGIAGGGGRGGAPGLADQAIASVGNGGLANANANGGTIMMGPIISGGNKGNTIMVGSDGSCIDGPVYIDGGDVDNSLNINLDASGGIAIADASGGSNNSGMAGGGGDAGALSSVGNGGDARANANGGTIMMGPIISGDNEGNTIQVAGGPCGEAPAGENPGKPGKPADVQPGKTVKPGKPGGGVVTVSTGKVKTPKVKAVPSTGVGEVPGLLYGLVAAGGSLAAGAAGLRRRRD